MLVSPDETPMRRLAPIPEPLLHHDCVALGDGRVLVVGGLVAADKASNRAYVYALESDSWDATGSLATGRHQAAVVALPGGRPMDPAP